MEEIEDKKVKITFEELEENSQIKIIKINGYVDSYNSKYFQDTTLGYIKDGARNVIMNCRELNYLSSAGIGSFVAISEELKDKGTLVLCNVQPKVQEIFSLLGFEDFFNICTDYEEAVQKAQEMLSKEEPSVLADMEAKIVFPFTFECRICGRKLKVSKPGKYNCPLCKSTITIDKEGMLSYPRGDK